MRRYFAFAGPIGSGKSSVSKLFATTIGAEWRGFGATVKEIAVARGLPTTREDLQTLGARLVENEPSTFCRQVIGLKTDKDVVIDGLRHVGILKELQSIVGNDSLVCVYVDVPQSIRLERLKVRDGLSLQQLTELEKHSTEIEVSHGLKDISDFVVRNFGSVENCVECIVQWRKGIRAS